MTHGLLGWWRKRSGGGPATAQDRQLVDETIERVVQTTNPRLKFARRYRAAGDAQLRAGALPARRTAAAREACRGCGAAARLGSDREVAAQREVQRHLLREPFGLHAHELGARTVEAQLGVNDRALVGLADAVLDSRIFQGALVS